MKVFLISTILSLIFSGQAFAAENNHHNHKVSSKTKEAKPSKKFVPDEALKERMNSILGAMKELEMQGVVAEKKKHVVTTGTRLESIVEDIFKTCKLAPEADASIHPILTQILEGASMLKKGDERNGHEKIHKALLKYEDYFEHSGWKHSPSH